jgi:APA family basic amino acid/polyamine antiporter
MTAKLKRQLTLYGLTMISIGSCIGSGIFFTPSDIAGYLSNPLLILLVWIMGSFAALCGALTFAELGGMFPNAGGMYAYIKEGYGKLMAFLFGWANLAVINTSSMAVLSLVFAQYMSFLIPMDLTMQLVVAFIALGLVTSINIFRVKWAEYFASTFTTLKIIGILFLIGVGLFLGVQEVDFSMTSSNTSIKDSSLDLLPAFGLAFIGVWFSVGGWQHSSYLTAEAKKPQKYIPLAMIIGTIVVGVIYFLVNLSYMYLLPVQDIAFIGLSPDEIKALGVSSNEIPKGDGVAAIAVNQVMGWGANLIAVVICISTLGTLGIYTMTAPRIYHAMADDGIFFKFMAKVHPKLLTPINAILVQSAFAGLFLLIFGGDKSGIGDLVTTLVFADTSFYIFVAALVIYFRVTRKNAERPYKTWLYPITPIIFIIITSFLAINTLVEKPIETSIGLLFLAIGLPLYWWFMYNQKKQQKE